MPQVGTRADVEMYLVSLISSSGGGSGREGSTTTIGNPIVHAWAIAPSIGNPITENMHFMRVKFVFIFGMGVVT